MSRYEFHLPDVGEGTTEAEISAWHVSVGDLIEEDKLLVDVMTDKASVEMTSPVSGVVLAIHGGIGERVPVGSVLVEFEVEDKERGVSVAHPARTHAVEAAAGAVVDEAPMALTGVMATLSSGLAQSAASRAESVIEPLASPSVRRRARELGVALEVFSGSGPGGRVTEQDVEQYRGRTAAKKSSTAAEQETISEIKIIGLRRKIAERMQESKRRIPHFTYVEEFDLTALEALRGELNARRVGDQPKLTLLPFFMRALVRLVPDFPTVNSRYDDDNGVLRSYSSLHIGIATQTPGGLMVPVVRYAESLSLWQSARELTRVTAAARDGTATREELIGSTITLTSLGALGGISATPIINHPEVAIIGPNKLVERPVVWNHAVTIRTMMNVSSSFDHRIVDGHESARFVQHLKSLIEQPSLMFLT